jgi:hypothetical protein
VVDVALLWIPKVFPASATSFSVLTTATLDKAKSKFLYDWRFTPNQFVLASSPLRLMTREFF